MSTAMQQRYSLDAEKTVQATKIAADLEPLAKAIFDWQAFQRGVGLYPAYGEAQREIEGMLESVKIEIGVRLQEHYKVRKDGTA